MEGRGSFAIGMMDCWAEAIECTAEVAPRYQRL